MKNLLAFTAALLVMSCSSQTATKNEAKTASEETKTTTKIDSTQVVTETVSGPVADAATIMSRPQVPVLCYHHIKEIDVLPKNSAGYTVTATQFRQQMKALADSGYHTVSPAQLYNYLTTGATLPSKPVMITYDDTDEEQFSIGKTEMDKYGFKGVYFIMTISIGRPRYMTKEQIRQLADEGHTVACHTWDHSRTDRYIVGDRMANVNGRMKKVNDWDLQLVDTKKKLEDITGKKIDYFAYPFGVWASSGIPEIKKRGYKLAFQLATKRDTLEPLYTVRRIIVPPASGDRLIREMKGSFK
jgi:peptidoglycan/xylan/chitin deacetylase (PgdA/CDA1 family)